MHCSDVASGQGSLQANRSIVLRVLVLPRLVYVKIPLADKGRRIVHERRVIPGSVVGDSFFAALIIEFGVILVAAVCFAVIGEVPRTIRGPVRIAAVAIAAVAIRSLPVSLTIFV